MKDNKLQTLTIYMKNGATFRFEEVTGFLLVPTEEGLITFDYVSKSRGVAAHAVFARGKVAGWSIGE